VPALAQVLGNSERPPVRQAATEALASIGSAAKAAVPALVRNLEDPQREIRSATIVALARIGMGAKEAVPALRRLPGQDPQLSVLAELAIKRIEGKRTSDGNE